MTSQWLKSNVDYGRKLLLAGLDGARSNREQALGGKPATLVLSRSATQAWMPTILGACAGAVSTQLCHKQKAVNGTTVLGALLGAAVGFTTGLAWNTRHVTQVLARGAMKATTPVRDAHWLARNPVNYG